MQEPKPYAIADRALRILNRRIIRLFDSALSQMRMAKFDELNVAQQCNTLYEDIDKAARKKYRELFVLRYGEVRDWIVTTADGTTATTDGTTIATTATTDEDAIEDLAEAYIAGLLSDPNPVTGYAWDTEILRKRDRAIEAVNAAVNVGEKQAALKRQQRHIAAQVGYYTDMASQEAELSAMRDACVKRVMRHEMNDDKVCKDCKDAIGEIYDIDKIPPLPHPHCRRWFTPVQ